MTKITLPYPPSILNPNSRVHWTKKAKAAKAYKNDCRYATFYLRKEMRGKCKFALTFCPPDSRRRDIDNMLASFKSGLDALAWRTEVDDSEFQLTITKGEPVKGGAVIVEVLD